MWVLVQVLLAPLMIQLPSKVSGKVAECGSIAWAPTPTWETCMRLLASVQEDLAPTAQSLLSVRAPFKYQ